MDQTAMQEGSINDAVVTLLKGYCSLKQGY